MSNNNVNNLIAVSDGDDRAGTATWWRLDSIVSTDKLEQAWRDAGLPEDNLPQHTTPTQALKRALQTHTGKDDATGGKILLRPLGKGNWALVHEQVDSDAQELDYTKKLVAGIDENGTPRFHPEWHPLVESLQQAYDAALETFDHTAMSHWLCKLVVKADSIPLRDGGGIYFIPPTCTGFWRKVADVVKEASFCKVYTMPVMKTDDAIAAALDGLMEDTQKKLDAISDEVVQDMSLRGLATRRDRCDGLLERLESYEGLLGSSLVSINERVESVRANIAESIFAHAAKLRDMNNAA
jgi:hypothetical protein